MEPESNLIARMFNFYAETKTMREFIDKALDDDHGKYMTVYQLEIIWRAFDWAIDHAGELE